MGWLLLWGVCAVFVYIVSTGLAGGLDLDSGPERHLDARSASTVLSKVR